MLFFLKVVILQTGKHGLWNIFMSMWRAKENIAVIAVIAKTKTCFTVLETILKYSKIN